MGLVSMDCLEIGVKMCTWLNWIGISVHSIKILGSFNIELRYISIGG
jgi:hypothetical protein